MSIELIKDLNDPQRTAVTAEPGHLLILAGAGSGKTSVLTRRIAWLIQHQQVSPYAILAVTFTNKAAAEMRGRIESLLQVPVGNMWVGTFHSLAHRLLRTHYEAAKLPQNFQILDSDDQNRLIRRIIVNLGLDDKQFQPKQAQWFINHKKDEGIRPKDLNPGDMYNKTLARIYQLYEETCQQSGLVDFAELLLRSQDIWIQHPDILAHYQQRFNHILVDEFQDTNATQYNWIRLLAGNQAHVMIVGDDDQSIYGWRGAKIENIKRFNQDFGGAQTIRLEQNYRSTGNILAAANALISNNDGRLGKNLWTDGGNGELISLYAAFNETDEARFIVDNIRAWIHDGNLRSEVAILYRSNAQSRVLEETLIQAAIPYRIYGGLRFFDRAEIKDALAYLRLIANRHDDPAFERVVNTPTRGIGEQTLDTLRHVAREQQIALWQAAERLVTSGELPARATKALSLFLQLIDNMSFETAEFELGEQTEYMLQHSGLLEHFAKEKGEKGQARLENLTELGNAARQFNPPLEDNMPPLASFLAHAALEAGDNQAEAFSDCVQLMTLHSAKGLEFPLVFLAGVEEGLFPHPLSIEEPGRLEEERRLCYVGMTRAMRKLYLTYAESRRLHGNSLYHRPSRFIREIPEQLLEEVRIRKSNITRPLSSSSRFANNINHNATFAYTMDQTVSDTGLSIGQRVAHPKFGEGTVLSFEGHGAHARVQVKFAQAGVKWLVASYANLQPV